MKSNTTIQISRAIFSCLSLIAMSFLISSCSWLKEKNAKGHTLKEIYFDNGNLYVKAYADDFGNYQGEAFFYYANGKDSMHAEYLDNQMHGPFKVFFENGKIKEIGQHDTGKRVSDLLIYNEEGELIKQQVFDKGSLLSEKKFRNKKCIEESAYDVSRGVLNSKVVYTKNGTIDVNKSQFVGAKWSKEGQLALHVQYPDAYHHVEIDFCKGNATTVPYKELNILKDDSYLIDVSASDYYEDQLNLLVKVYSSEGGDLYELKFESFIQLNSREMPNERNLDPIYHGTN